MRQHYCYLEQFVTSREKCRGGGGRAKRGRGKRSAPAPIINLLSKIAAPFVSQAQVTTVNNNLNPAYSFPSSKGMEGEGDIASSAAS